MDNKKEIERNNLHSTIWKIAEELRGAIDGWDFKQYVLGIYFIDIYQKISLSISTMVNANLVILISTLKHLMIM
ncbi:type I restriction-modification system subunit M N-terminal domain-containing protein [Ureaplasma urealyticum]|uniref:type I restriction-modification system subunit M N-terminal domain-containing protein n=1 Tax=Ureaplasma urealyticum TaxID=2130 RepID=UPI0002FF7362|nr:type I restriction-modification system subunit M N-terminal domain-containing protein [Ureaplasma urealyticum]